MNEEIRLTRSLEDYLEAIYLLQKEVGKVRVKDLANRLSVKLSSVSEAVGRLSELGLVEHELYGSISLTEDGIERAKHVYHRHMVLLKFFCEVLGIDREEAEKDSCILEHSISKKSLDKLIEFIERVVTPAEKS